MKSSSQHRRLKSYNFNPRFETQRQDPLLFSQGLKQNSLTVNEVLDGLKKTPDLLEHFVDVAKKERLLDPMSTSSSKERMTYYKTFIERNNKRSYEHSQRKLKRFKPMDSPPKVFEDNENQNETNDNFTEKILHNHVGRAKLSRRKKRITAQIKIVEPSHSKNEPTIHIRDSLPKLPLNKSFDFAVKSRKNNSSIKYQNMMRDHLGESPDAQKESAKFLEKVASNRRVSFRKVTMDGPIETSSGFGYSHQNSLDKFTTLVSKSYDIKLDRNNEKIQNKFKDLCGSKNSDVSYKNLRLKKIQLKNYIIKKYGKFGEKIFGFFNLNINFSFFSYVDFIEQFLNTKFYNLLKLAFQIYDINGDNAICANDIFSFMQVENEKLYNKAFQKDIMQIVKFINTKVKNAETEKKLQHIRRNNLLMVNKTDRNSRRLSRLVVENLSKGGQRRDSFSKSRRGSGSSTRSRRGSFIFTQKEETEKINEASRKKYKKKKVQKETINFSEFMTIDWDQQVPDFIHDLFYFLCPIKIKSLKKSPKKILIRKETEGDELREEMKISMAKKLFPPNIADNIIKTFQEFAKNPQVKISQMYLTQKTIKKRFEKIFGYSNPYLEDKFVKIMEDQNCGMHDKIDFDTFIFAIRPLFNEEEIEEQKKLAFHFYDGDNDGIIGIIDIIKFLEAVPDKSPISKEITKLMNLYLQKNVLCDKRRNNSPKFIIDFNVFSQQIQESLIIKELKNKLGQNPNYVSMCYTNITPIKQMVKDPKSKLPSPQLKPQKNKKKNQIITATDRFLEEKRKKEAAKQKTLNFDWMSYFTIPF